VSQPTIAPSTPAGSVKVLVVDDHPVLRHGLSALLRMEPWAAAIIEAGTVAEAVRLAVSERPNVAVVDLSLPDGSGVELIGTIRRTCPDCRVVVLTMAEDPDIVQDCLAAGASGYLRKATAPDAVIRAVLTAHEGGIVLGPQVGAAALRRTEPSLPAPFHRLAPRDLAVVRMLADGRSNAEIARALGVSEKTIRNRLSLIFGLLGVGDRIQAALLVRDAGLADPPRGRTT
jgi:two-component system nitrate/nitrite response regulator NarL